MAASTQALLQDLLEKTSRTFALSIPPLPEPTRNEVTIAYLLFRIADTLEDATHWSAERKLAELDAFADLIESPDAARAAACAQRWIDDSPLDHAGYLELLQHTPTVLDAWNALSPVAHDLVGQHTRRTIAGMGGFVEQERDGRLQLKDVAELRNYCYAVAGIVGEMLTELFLLDRQQLTAIAGDLRHDAARFGEALQLVNILKDVAGDIAEGRSFLPPDLDPQELFRLARLDLEAAGRYAVLLHDQGAPRGIVEFSLMPVLLAWATLDRVAEQGPGARLTRLEVRAILAKMELALDAGDLRGLCAVTEMDLPRVQP